MVMMFATIGWKPVLGSTLACGAVLVVSGCGTAPASQPDTSTAAPSASSAAPLLTSQEKQQRFVEAIGAQGGNASRDALLSMGERTCSAFGEGASAADIRGILMVKGLSQAQASRVILAAAMTLCPEFKKDANP